MPAGVPQGHMITCSICPTINWIALQKAIDRKLEWSARRETRETDVFNSKSNRLLRNTPGKTGSKRHFKYAEGMASCQFPDSYVSGYFGEGFGQPVIVIPD